MSVGMMQGRDVLAECMFDRRASHSNFAQEQSMSSTLARKANESAKESTPRTEAPVDSAPTPQPEPPGSPDKPYTKVPTAPELYRPYKELAVSERPYEPYKGI